MISFSRLIRSFCHAFRGIILTFRAEQSFRLQSIAGAMVLVIAWAFHISMLEWVILVILVGAVLCLELMNSVFERLLDTFKPRIHPVVRDIKDIMAALVLVACCVSAVVAGFMFFPRLLRLLSPFLPA